MARPKKKSKNKCNTRPKDSKIDWTENMSGTVWRLLECIPMVGNAIRALRRDPSSEAIEEIASEVKHLARLEGAVDQLNDLKELIVAMVHLEEEKTEVLNDLRDILQTYRRPDIVGQVTAYTIAAAGVAEIKRLADHAEQMAGCLKG